MEDYLRKQQRKFEYEADNYMKEANEVFRELSRQLIIVATVFISISGFIFSNDDPLIKIDVLIRYGLFAAWIFLGASLILGIVQFFIDYYFFRKWTFAKGDVVKSIHSGEANNSNLYKIAWEKQKDIPIETSTCFVWLQATSLGFGMVLLISTMVILLFT